VVCFIISHPSNSRSLHSSELVRRRPSYGRPRVSTAASVSTAACGLRQCMTTDEDPLCSAEDIIDKITAKHSAGFATNHVSHKADAITQAKCSSWNHSLNHDLKSELLVFQDWPERVRKRSYKLLVIFPAIVHCSMYWQYSSIVRDTIYGTASDVFEIFAF